VGGPLVAFSNLTSSGPGIPAVKVLMSVMMSVTLRVRPSEASTRLTVNLGDVRLGGIPRGPG
jgi:hypothetical protein